LYNLINVKLTKSVLKQLSRSIVIRFINDFIAIIKLFNNNDKNIKSSIYPYYQEIHFKRKSFINSYMFFD